MKLAEDHYILIYEYTIKLLYICKYIQKNQARVKALMATFDASTKAKIPEDILATIREVVVDRLRLR